MPLWARRVRRKRRLGSSARPQWQEHGWDDLCHSPSIRGGGPCEEGGVAEGQRQLRGGGCTAVSLGSQRKSLPTGNADKWEGREGGKILKDLLAPAWNPGGMMLHIRSLIRAWWIDAPNCPRG